MQKQHTQLQTYKSDYLPIRWRSQWQVIHTLALYFLSYYMMYRSMAISYWLTAIFIFLTAGLVVRTFALLHDCVHGSLFTSYKTNLIVGTILGILTFTPYARWRHSHLTHHRTHGNLDMRGIGDVWTLTVDEFHTLSRGRRIFYKAFRSPWTLFTITPTLLFFILFRFSKPNDKRKERISVYLTNLAIMALIGLLIYAVGLARAAIMVSPTMIIASTVGVWMFYVQHQFENCYWERTDNWDFASASLAGSSYYKLPYLLQWFTGNLGFHHIHHLSPRIPNYKLEMVHNRNAHLSCITSITFFASLQLVRLRLWDEKLRLLVKI